jgi:hypothetical protein
MGRGQGTNQHTGSELRDLIDEIAGATDADSQQQHWLPEWADPIDWLNQDSPDVRPDTGDVWSDRQDSLKLWMVAGTDAEHVHCLLMDARPVDKALHRRFSAPELNEQCVLRQSGRKRAGDMILRNTGSAIKIIRGQHVLGAVSRVSGRYMVTKPKMALATLTGCCPGYKPTSLDAAAQMAVALFSCPSCDRFSRQWCDCQLP